ELIGRSEAGFGGFEAAFLFQAFFFKRLTTPKEKTDAFLQLAVPDHGVAIQKPHRVRVPYFVFRLRQSLVDLPSQKITDVPILRTEGLIVLKGVGMHNCGPSGGTRLLYPASTQAKTIEQRWIARWGAIARLRALTRLQFHHLATSLSSNSWQTAC